MLAPTTKTEELFYVLDFNGFLLVATAVAASNTVFRHLLPQIWIY